MPEIGIVTHNVDPGGAQRIAIREAKLLEARGYDTTLVSLIKPREPWASQLEGVDLRYVLDVGDGAISEAVSRLASGFAPLPGDPDVYLCHNLPGAQLGYRAKRRDGTPYLAYVHDATAYPVAGSPFGLLFGKYSPEVSTGDLGIRGRLGLSLEERWLGGADTVLANAGRTARDLRRRHALDPTILYPTLIGDVHAAVETTPAAYFLVVQRLDPHPTYDVLERLLDRLADLQVVIAGSSSAGYLERKIRGRFERFGERVRFVIDPSDAALSTLYREALAYLQPGVENFNMSALEAASAGRPIVVAAESGITDLFEDYPLFAPTDDIAGFERAIRSLLEDPDYARQLGREAASVAADYDETYHVDRLVELLDASLGRHG